jgi:hypothetical protein
VKRLGTRIGVLEGHQRVGCPTCRHWHGVVIADSFGGRSRPDRCPDCGRAVPPVQIVLLEGIHWDCV